VGDPPLGRLGGRGLRARVGHPRLDRGDPPTRRVAQRAGRSHRHHRRGSPRGSRGGRLRSDAGVGWIGASMSFPSEADRVLPWRRQRQAYRGERRTAIRQLRPLRLSRVSIGRHSSLWPQCASGTARARPGEGDSRSGPGGQLSTGATGSVSTGVDTPATKRPGQPAAGQGSFSAWRRFGHVLASMSVTI
jgi:hypothetical protein